jgi:drug/metabolite transporter (DMT)-like permease
LLISILVMVLGFLVLGSGGIGRWIIVSAVLVFIGAFALSLRRQSRPSQQKYWRDRPMDLDDHSGRSGRGRRRGPR